MILSVIANRNELSLIGDDADDRRRVLGDGRGVDNQKAVH